MKKRSVLILFFFINVVAFAQNEKHIDAQGTFKKEINSLGKNDKIQKAFKIIQDLEPTSIKELIELTEIPAPPFQEQKRAEHYKKMLHAAGIDSIWIDEVGNVLALRKGSGNGKTVLIDAHLDTVFPIETDVTVKLKGDTLYAPGIGDDTRGLSMMLSILKSMNGASIKTESDILFVATVGEEGLGDLRGIKNIFKQGAKKIDSHIAIDGGDINSIISSGLGSIRYKVTFNGPGGHSFGAFGLANPHHAMGKAIDYFSTVASDFVSSGPKTTFNVGRIGGGTSVNSIPFETWIEVDMRSLSPEKLIGLEKILKEQMTKALNDYNSTIKNGPKLSLNFEKIGERPSGIQDENLAIIQRAIAANEFFNRNAQIGAGSTNSNIPISLGIPSITIGCGGNSGNAHSLDEWWINDRGAEAIKFGLLLLVSEAGLSK